VIQHAARATLLLLLALGSASCTVPTKHTYAVPSQPYDGYPAVTPIPLGVELVLTNELLAARWERDVLGTSFEIPLGALLAKNAEALARATFSSVSVSRGFALQAGSDPAVLTPRVVAIERTPHGGWIWAWQDMTLTVAIEWRLEARGGALVWLDTLTGSGTSNAGNYFTADETSEPRVAAAMEALFRASSEAMRRSPEIARFAAKTTTP